MLKGDLVDPALELPLVLQNTPQLKELSDRSKKLELAQAFQMSSEELELGAVASTITNI